MQTLLAIGVILSLLLHLQIEVKFPYRIDIKSDGIWWRKEHGYGSSTARRIITWRKKRW